MTHAMKVFAFSLLASGSFVAAATGANAQAVVNSTQGAFGPATGGAGVVISNGATRTALDSIRWGQGGQSGLDFQTTSNLAVVPGTEFTLGTLTYLNQPINSGTAITSTAFTTQTDFTYNGMLYHLPTLNFSISVDETPNTPPCAYGATPANNPCNDRIGITPTGSQAISVSGGTLTFYVDGFTSAGSTTPSQYFIAPENGSTVANLVGHFSVSAVPEAATWAMMIAGFGMVGGAMRRRVRSVAVA